MKTCSKCGEDKPESDYYRSVAKRGKVYHRTECGSCFNAANNEKLKKRIVAKRKKALDHYGAHCACCGEDTDCFLTFDHKNNDGAEHRKTVSPGWSLYSWLDKDNYPDTIQVLCYNCNWGRYRMGVCPHQLSKEE